MSSLFPGQWDRELFIGKLLIEMGFWPSYDSNSKSISNKRGADFEFMVAKVLCDLAAWSPQRVSVVRHPPIHLQSGETVYADFDLTVRLNHERTLYLIECQSRERADKSLLHKIQHLRAKSRRNSVIFVHETDINEEVERAMEGEGIMCYDFEAFKDYTNAMTMHIPPSAPPYRDDDPDPPRDHAMFTSVRR